MCKFQPEPQTGGFSVKTKHFDKAALCQGHATKTQNQERITFLIVNTMTHDEIETILKAEFIGEMKGLGQAIDLMEQCVFYCEADKKNYVNGDKLINLVRERKKLLINRLERGRNY